jgi:hypothetical protein
MLRTATYFVSALVAFAPLGSLHAAGTAEQQLACFDDAIKFCGSEIPDVQRITDCMVRNIHKLSPRCRAQFGQRVVSPEPIRTCSSHPTTSPAALSCP